jgi:hypothetical protein
MRCFRVEFKNGSCLRLRACHAWCGEGMLHLIVHREERSETGCSVAAFPIAEVLRVYAEESLVSGGDDSPSVDQRTARRLVGWLRPELRVVIATWGALLVLAVALILVELLR